MAAGCTGTCDMGQFDYMTHSRDTQHLILTSCTHSRCVAACKEESPECCSVVALRGWILSPCSDNSLCSSDPARAGSLARVDGLAAELVQPSLATARIAGWRGARSSARMVHKARAPKLMLADLLSNA